MDDTVIKVENISKRYRLGSGGPYKTIRESIANVFKKPVFSGSKNGTQEDAKSGDLWALRDVSFDVKQGEIVGVIGRNGAGKSTLLKILARITEPTTGRITMKGRIGSLLEVGTGFHPELSGHENIYLYGAILGMDRYEVTRKFDEIIAFAELEKFVETPVKRYSSGMYMRLAFAVAAHLDPEILLVDEVLAVGDAGFQKKCLGKMDEVSKGGRTVLFVSHNMSSIQRLCTRGILLDKGNVLATDTAMRVTELYVEKGIATSFGWKREEPAKSDAYFTRVHFADVSNRMLDCLTTADPACVIMEYTLNKQFRDLQLSLDLLDRGDEMIFGSQPQDVGVSLPNERGNFRIRVILPGEILLARTYSIRAVLWQPTLGVLDRVDSIRFSVQEANTFASGTPDGRPGLIAVRCAWKLESYEKL